MSDSKYEGLQIANPLTLEPEWLAKVQEEIFDPERVIIDTHHHLWSEAGLIPYSLDDFLADTGSGHAIKQTVFIECGSQYRQGGSDALKPVGETEFVAALAKEAALAAAAEPGGGGAMCLVRVVGW